MTKPEQITLFSETNIYGAITFVNEAFCMVAKYSKEELIGKPHNIIRHPDMPKKLFQLLWDTIKKGEVFRAVIKNRAKDGTCYCVQAIIMPIQNNNKEVIKFIGARHLINDDKKAQELYAQQIELFKL
jgi:PAS domain S-box-containing protein